MLKQNLAKDDVVIFGRGNGEKTKGIVVKLNPKKAKIKILEDRGSKSKAGEIWTVPYSLIDTVVGVEGDIKYDFVDPAEEPIEYSVFQPQVEQLILQAIDGIYASLSPENLSCDGELSMSQVFKRRNSLKDKLKHLQNALGRPVSEEVVYNWLKQKQQKDKEVLGGPANLG
jgi:hypothetical protein